jgi:2-keto-4-pentenoate hydratase
MGSYATRMPNHAPRTTAPSNQGRSCFSGSFIRIVEARPGDTFHADFGPYGSVSCHFN